LNRLRLPARIVTTLIVGVLLSSVALSAPPAIRAAAPDKSEVVLVLDFSASILEDKANREKFAAALDRMADRVDETSADLVAGDSTMSLVQFASKAIDTPGCTELRVLNDPDTVAKFADCLRTVATAYRKGLDPALTKKIGRDTNYVAAMQQADKHLPADAVRPAMILFTDGKHDVAGTPVSQVQSTRDRLFGKRTPFALLPVGMGLDPKERGPLEAGLAKMKITRDMPACVSGATFDWPQVVFDSAEDAGNAVAVAVQDATCTFTVAPTPEPTPVPTPEAPAIPAVRGITVVPGDGRVQLAWTAPAIGTPGAEAILDYHARCRAGEGDWVESTEGVSLAPNAEIEGLKVGTPYQCEVAAVSKSGDGPWTPATATVTPIGRPAPPAQPTVSAQDSAVVVSVAASDPGVVSTHVECSPDNGATWPLVYDIAASADPTIQIAGLANGTEYVCRAFSINQAGRSDASPLSNLAKPCGSSLDCNPTLVPIIAALGVLLGAGILLALIAFARSRRRGYVLAVVDVVHTANLGYGSNIGIGFVRDPSTKRVTDIVSDKGKTAEIRIVHHKSGFEVRDRHGRQVAPDGQAVVITDSLGARHEVVLRAFNTNAASPVATRR